MPPVKINSSVKKRLPLLEHIIKVSQTKSYAFSIRLRKRTRSLVIFGAL
jgi:hypothetical protein